MTQWSVSDDCLVVGGMPLSRLAMQVGRTPFYAYDRRLLTARVGELRRHVPSAIRLHYAMKANPMPALVCHMAGLVDGLDVASGGELKIALDAAVDPAEISFAGPGKSEHELAQAVAAGILVNVESPREVALLAQFARLPLRLLRHLLPLLLPRCSKRLLYTRDPQLEGLPAGALLFRERGVQARPLRLD